MRRRITWMAWLGSLLWLWCASVPAVDADWFTDYQTAAARAKKENRMMLLDFTGSDWCPDCRILKKKIFSKKGFKEYAAKKLVLVELDYPVRTKQSAALKEQNQALLERFEVEGYPTIILLNGEEKVLLRLDGYVGNDWEEFVKQLKKAEEKT